MGRRSSALLAFAVKIPVNIAVSFEYADNFEAIIHIPEHDDISAKREASQVRPQIVSWPPHIAWQFGKIRTLATQQENKTFCPLGTAAFLADISVDACEIGSCTG
jgi:hypothetical protein